eukprot:TRINITY_DN7085_c0_g1_i2.p1 TRINITY_DN7085_c0_g1~~TRINITY_DN7085_c0_g1_i2.p1  ORF type:complete len:316 (-),score=59.35 TRINITY_DN7085_c0_g1_i2:262-1209(-)
MEDPEEITSPGMESIFLKLKDMFLKSYNSIKETKYTQKLCLDRLFSLQSLRRENLSLILEIYGKNLRVFKTSYPKISDKDVFVLAQWCPNVECLKAPQSQVKMKAFKILIDREVFPFLNRLAIGNSGDLSNLRKMASKVSGLTLTIHETKIQGVTQEQTQTDPFANLTEIMIERHKKETLQVKLTEWDELLDDRLKASSPADLIHDIMDLSSAERQERLIIYCLKAESSPEDVRVLIPILDDPSEHVRVWAVFCLSQIGTSKAINALMKRSKYEQSTTVKTAINFSVTRHLAEKAGIFETNEMKSTLTGTTKKRL